MDGKMSNNKRLYKSTFSRLHYSVGIRMEDEMADNNKSKRVLLKSGFEEIGVNKKYLYINGKWRDHITFYKILE